jgi:thymidylate synthase (FAD)
MKVTYVAETVMRTVEVSNAIWRRTGGNPENPFDNPDAVWMDWDDEGAAGLSEFAGRACYESWSRPNPKTATNQGYLEHILEIGHESVIEHGSASIYIEDVSRSCTHELVRHRHFSYSQLSQRFVTLKRQDVMAEVKPGEEPYIIPPLFAEDDIAGVILQSAWAQACDHYDQLVERAEQLLADTPGMAGTIARKRAREAARAVLPNMTPTAIVVTGNHRAFRQAIINRASPYADLEIRELFVMIFRELSRWQPALYQDMIEVTGDDGRVWVGRG